ncbi:MAG: Icc-related predicted phosphoesterase [Alteromonadaceae bacterium]|jgi:Icc-related predicted phosphoesterase
MKIQLLSDLHVEFADYQYCPTDAEVVVLAGDISVGERGLAWAMSQIKDKPVLYVLGNHEYYRHTYPKLIDTLKSRAQGSDVIILENDIWQLDGVNFFGATLWTDFSVLGDPSIAGFHCQQMMNDYKKINRLPSYSTIRAMDIAGVHSNSRQWLGDALKSHRGERNVVITHHGPSLQSVPEDRKEDIFISAYVSDLTDFIAEHQPHFWLHGHLHNSTDHIISSCRVLCNPKGYPDNANDKFNPQLCFVV